MHQIHASSEIGRLRRILIHTPDNGIGKIIPDKAQDWLYDDIVDLDKMREEYKQYVQLLLWFLDPDKARQAAALEDNQQAFHNFLNPSHPDYFNSDKVLDVQFVLGKILEDEMVKIKLVASICSIEQCNYYDQELLLKLEPVELARTLISGFLSVEDRFIFPPVPNLIFTRDIAITVHDHLLLTRFAKQARYREALITKYLAFYFFFNKIPKDWHNVVEITEHKDFFLMDEKGKKENRCSIEGGDVMMIAPRHLMVGCSERTSVAAINQLIVKTFNKGLLDKITVVKIPAKRNFMHIDTLFTMVKKNVWVLYGPLSKKGKKERAQSQNYTDMLRDDRGGNKALSNDVQIVQYDRNNKENNYLMNYNETDNPKPEELEDLFTQICRKDFNCSLPMQFVYSGGGQFPYNQREQWTDSCNVLALKEGVVIGYDRNHKTAESFERDLDFRVIKATDLIAEFRSGQSSPDDINDTLILLPSAELSRARGGSHCMSMPLWREEVE